MTLVLAGVGLYTVVAHTVRRRTREVGIRIAVGATRRHVVAAVFGRGLRAIGVGLPIGLAISLLVNPRLRSQVVGVSPTDPLALLTAPMLLVCASVLGCWLPARRAVRVDPASVLRAD